MSPRAVREYLDTLRPRYGLAKKPKKKRLPPEAGRVTSYNLKAIVLHPHRRRHLRRPLILNPATAALRSQIPLRTFGDWQGVRPGAVQADLVAHCGETSAGFYLHTLIAVDVATGWTECDAVWGKAFRRVGTAVHLVRQRFPVPLRELHTDNGGGGLSHILVPWCRQEGLRLTRGRPYRKNDQAYAEQKVWTQVRRIVGYDRYSTQAAYTHL